MSGRTLFDSNVSSKELTNITGLWGFHFAMPAVTLKKSQVASLVLCDVQAFGNLVVVVRPSFRAVAAGDPHEGAPPFPTYTGLFNSLNNAEIERRYILGVMLFTCIWMSPKRHQTWQASTKSRQLQKLRLRLVVVEGEGWLPNIVTFAEKAAEKVRPSHRISSAKSSHWICR